MRDANGMLQADPVRFPSGIKALADYVSMLYIYLLQERNIFKLCIFLLYFSMHTHIGTLQGTETGNIWRYTKTVQKH